ncbi:hypothetical protein GCM10011335_39680 [Aureimonas glaciei]|uniref:Phytase-like domain-containing protein n=2 Tax=Aureimonas glaciei TaxID=1776957 RepID=A0A916Y734_9HYPH|nr:hypothetical protein GCM10011335_39680 [Aureimonas glaciei]
MVETGMKRRRQAPLAAALCAGLAWLQPASAIAEQREITVAASPIASFAADAAVKRFGALGYVGGFSYSSRDGRLAGVSAIRLLHGRSRFLAVTDTGYWFSGAIRRDAEGRPTGFDETAMAPILGPDGEPRTRRKGLADAEGLAIDGDRALVSFERDHRIEAFANPDNPFDSRPSGVAQPIPLRELRGNAGIEAIAVDAGGAGREKRTVIVTEQSIDRDGNLFAAILGPAGGLFKVVREEPWSVTDSAFLPDGDLLLLERRYQGFGRIGMRLRRLGGGEIRPGALVDGPVLMEADFGQQIDNMEGLDVSVGDDGHTYIAVVSDDNGSMFQRNLYLEFVLDGPGPS